MTHLVDLIQYAATHIDAQGKANQARQIVTGAAETVSVVGKEVKEKTKQRLSSLGNLVDDTTKDLKEQSVKATVAVVATIAQASEIVRRRLVSGASSLSVEETKIAMENRLKEILGQTTSYANSLTVLPLPVFYFQLTSSLRSFVTMSLWPTKDLLPCWLIFSSLSIFPHPRTSVPRICFLGPGGLLLFVSESLHFFPPLKSFLVLSLRKSSRRMWWRNSIRRKRMLLRVSLRTMPKFSFVFR